MCVIKHNLFFFLFLRKFLKNDYQRVFAIEENVNANQSSAKIEGYGFSEKI